MANWFRTIEMNIIGNIFFVPLSTHMQIMLVHYLSVFFVASAWSDKLRQTTKDEEKKFLAIYYIMNPFNFFHRSNE